MTILFSFLLDYFHFIDEVFYEILHEVQLYNRVYACDQRIGSYSLSYLLIQKNSIVLVLHGTVCRVLVLPTLAGQTVREIENLDHGDMLEEKLDLFWLNHLICLLLKYLVS